jgi:3-deoxy-D-manno-octulosonic-acid transferase
MDKNRLAQQFFLIIYNGMLLVGLVFLFPFIASTLARKAKWRHTFRERMGWCRSPWQCDAGRQAGKCVWVHALSVGEVMAAQPLVARLQQSSPKLRICFTASTYTGVQTAQRLFGHLEGVRLSYFPYDWIGAVRRAAAQINPSIVIITETDIWPNFLLEMHRRHVPVGLVNLRLSEKSWKNYRRFRWAAKFLLNGFRKIAVQDDRDLKRLISLGINSDKVSVTGNLKFDGMTPDRAADTTALWRRNLGIASDKRVLVAGSTHAGEEKALLQVLAVLTHSNHTPILILAPRDPLRSAEIIASCRTMGLAAGSMTSVLNDSLAPTCPQVVVVDSIGILKTLYGLADVVFVGGSLVPCGGHNPLEPAVWGKPVLFGPDMGDFPLISELLLETGAAQRVMNTEELLRAVRRLLADPQLAQEMGSRALALVDAHRGAVDRTLAFMGLLSSGVGRGDPRC